MNPLGDATRSLHGMCQLMALVWLTQDAWIPGTAPAVTHQTMPVDDGAERLPRSCPRISLHGHLLFCLWEAQAQVSGDLPGL